MFVSAGVSISTSADWLANFALTKSLPGMVLTGSSVGGACTITRFKFEERASLSSSLTYIILVYRYERSYHHCIEHL